MTSLKDTFVNFKKHTDSCMIQDNSTRYANITYHLRKNGSR